MQGLGNLSPVGDRGANVSVSGTMLGREHCSKNVRKQVVEARVLNTIVGPVPLASYNVLVFVDGANHLGVRSINLILVLSVRV